MMKKLLCLFFSLLLVTSCLPITSQAAEISENASGDQSILVSANAKEKMEIILSVNAVSNVQGIFVDFDKCYSKFSYVSYEVLASELSNANVCVVNSPDGHSYDNIYASILMPAGGVSFSKKTDLLKITYKARSSNVTDLQYYFRVKEFYNTSMKELSSSYLSIRSGSDSTPTLTSLKVTPPNKTTYTVGDTVDKTGLKVEAVYSDGSSEDVTSLAQISGFANSTSSAGTKTVTVSYGTLTSTFTVTVNAATLTSISIAAKPTKLTYSIGESFDKTGIKVVANYSNSTTVDVTSQVSYSGFSSSSAGTKTVQVSYGGKSASFTVTVVNNDLVNNSTISATSVTERSTVTIKGAASGGSGSYKYAYYVKRSSAAEWTVKGTEFGTATSATFTPGYIEVYQVKVIVKDSSNKTATKTFNVNVTESTLANNSKLSATTVSAGTTVTVTGAASGGTAPYKYAFYVQTSGSSTWKLKGTAYGSDKSASIVPSSVGTYKVKVYVKDNTGKVVSKQMSLKVTESTLANNSKLSASTVIVGTTVTVTGAASSGAAPYKYAFYVKSPGSSEWKLKGTKYGSDTSAVIQPNCVGTYQVKVYVKDNTGKSVYKQMSLKVTESTLVNNSKLSASSVIVGTKVTVTGAASDGVTPYKYAFYVKSPGSSEWKLKGTKYGSDTSAVIQPNCVGTYQVKVYVKDNTGKSVYKQMSLKVTESTLVNNSKLSASTVTDGTTVTVTGAASSGVAPYKYAFYVKSPGSSTWKLKGTKYGSYKSAVIQPNCVGTYQIKVYVKDNTGKAVLKQLSLKVTASTLANNSEVSASSVKTGTKVTVTGAASGGTSPYKYAFYVKSAGSSTWKLKGTAYGTDKSAEIIPSSVGTYQVKVNVKDNTGKVVSKTMDIKVTK